VTDLKMIISDFVQVHNTFMPSKTVAVYGDLMMDLYEQVQVNRLSPEFPIPVIDCGKNRSVVARPGGAGNVCEQLRHFKANTHLFSFIDGSSWTAFEEIVKFNLHTCYQCPCHVPVKRRYYDEDFPLCRMDNELPNYGLYNPVDARITLLKKFVKFADEKKIDVAILSDYNKGVFDQSTASLVIAACRDRAIKTVVDPKKNHFQWKNCTIFKPNLSEAADFLRISTGEFLARWRECVSELRDMVKCQSVVVTNGGKGVFGIENEEFFEYTPEHPAKDVRSVIGAGDSFAATLALAVAHGYLVRDAVEIAYEAAAVYVQKKHNEPVWPHELLARVEPSYSKILAPSDMAQVCHEYKGKKKLVFTNGCFDILHPGHVSTLEFAKRQGDILIVALNTDESVARLKGDGRPVNQLYDRRIIVAAMECVDFVTYFQEDTPRHLIEAIKPDIIVKGGDYNPEEVVGNDLCRVLIAPTCKGLSTSSIIERLKTP